jgi:hypothetical protein
VYATAVDDVAKLQKGARRMRVIPSAPGIYERVRHSLIRRSVHDVETHGQHFERFLLQFVVDKTVIFNIGIGDL